MPVEKVNTGVKPLQERILRLVRFIEERNRAAPELEKSDEDFRFEEMLGIMQCMEHKLETLAEHMEEVITELMLR